MMKKFKQQFVFIVLFVLSNNIFSQDMHQPEMADSFYKDGKIYIVISVLSIVLIGVLVYLFSMDRKLNKLEKELKDKKQVELSRKFESKKPKKIEGKIDI